VNGGGQEEQGGENAVGETERSEKKKVSIYYFINL
jgi:hypothetical protein